ncbi:uncharacterized protein LOC120334293 isoform X2 [Styela clava]
MYLFGKTRKKTTLRKKRVINLTAMYRVGKTRKKTTLTFVLLRLFQGIFFILVLLEVWKQYETYSEIRELVSGKITIKKHKFGPQNDYTKCNELERKAEYSQCKCSDLSSGVSALKCSEEHGQKQTFQPGCPQECVDGNNDDKKKSAGASTNSNPQQTAQITSGGNSASEGISSQGSYGTGDGDGDPEKNRRNRKIVSGCANDNGISVRENQDENNGNHDENRENSYENEGNTILEHNRGGHSSIATAGNSGRTDRNERNVESEQNDIAEINQRRTSITHPTQQEQIQQAFSPSHGTNRGDRTKPNRRGQEHLDISTQGTSGNENHRRTIPHKRRLPEPAFTDTGQGEHQPIVRKRPRLGPEQCPNNQHDFVPRMPRSSVVDRRLGDEDPTNNVRNRPRLDLEQCPNNLRSSRVDQRHVDEDPTINVRNRPRLGPERCPNNRRDIALRLLYSNGRRLDDEDPTNNIAYEPQRPDRTFYHPPEILREGRDIAASPVTIQQHPLQSSRIESYGIFQDFPLNEEQQAASRRRPEVRDLDDYDGNLIAYDQPRQDRTLSHPASPREGMPWICGQCGIPEHPDAPQFCPVCGVFLCEEHIRQQHRCIYDRVFDDPPINDEQQAMEGGEENAEIEGQEEDQD